MPGLPPVLQQPLKRCKDVLAHYSHFSTAQPKEQTVSEWEQSLCTGKLLVHRLPWKTEHKVYAVTDCDSEDGEARQLLFHHTQYSDDEYSGSVALGDRVQCHYVTTRTHVHSLLEVPGDEKGCLIRIKVVFFSILPLSCFLG